MFLIEAPGDGAMDGYRKVTVASMMMMMMTTKVDPAR